MWILTTIISTPYLYFITHFALFASQGVKTSSFEQQA